MHNNYFQMKKIWSLISLVCLLFLISGCESCRKNKNNDVILKVDRQKAAEVKLNIKIKRFEHDLMEGSTTDLKIKSNQLKDSYGYFFNIFCKNIINIGPPENAAFLGYLNDFTTDKSIREIYAEVKKDYSDLSILENEFSDALSNYKVLFPDKKIPQVVSFISGFNYSIITTDSVLGIGLDMFLGADCKFYKLLGMPMYKVRAMRREMIVSDGIRSWISTEFETKLPKEDLLSMMIQEGKFLYLMDNIFPDAPDSIKISFSAKELEWCKNSEGSIWKFIVDKKLLFSSEYKENIKWIKEAPFTAGLPRESPGRVGSWVGWQIIRSYMKNNQTLTVYDLMNNIDAQNILNQSRYKPFVNKK